MPRRALLGCLLASAMALAAGDALPEGAVTRLGSVRLRPGGSVTRLAFSPDGTKVASWSYVHGVGSYLCTWEVKTGKLLRRFDVPGVTLEGLTWLADGRGVALVRTGWDRQGHCIRDFTDESTPPTGRLPIGFSPALAPGNGGPRGHSYDSAFAVSPDGKTLAVGRSGEARRPQSISLHPLKVGLIENLPAGRRLADQPDNCWQLLFTPDGRRLVAFDEPEVVGRRWGATQRVVVWDAATRKEVSRFVAPRSEVDGRIVVAASNQLLAIGTTDGDVSTWDLATGKERRIATGHVADGPGRRSGTFTVAYIPDGKTLMSGGADGRVKLWEASTGKHLRTMDRTHTWIEALAVSPDGRTIASAGQDGVIRLWDAATGRDVCPPVGHTFRVSKAALTPDGKTAVTLGMDRTLRVWDAAIGRELRKADLPALGWLMALSPDGKGAVTGMHETRLQSWDVATGRETTPAGLPADLHASAIAFAPDGTRVVAAAKGRVSVLEWPGMRVVRTIDLPAPAKSPGGTECHAVAVSPDGRRLLTLARRNDSGMMQDGVADLWDVASGKRVRRLAESAGAFQFATFTLDSHVILSAYTTATVPAEGGRPAETFEGGAVVLDPKAGRLVRPLLPPAPRQRGQRRRDRLSARVAALSPDGRTLYVAHDSGALVALEVATGQPRRTFTGPGESINDLAVSRDGQRLVSGGQDGTALVWNVAVPGTARPLAAAGVEAAWAKVATGTDARAAFEAMAGLAAAPERAVAVVRREVLPAPATPSDAELDRLFDDLDSDDFATREKATAELNRYSEAMASRVRQRLDRATSAEVRRRVKPFLDQFAAKELSAARVAQMRAVELLEGIGTPEAKALLADLAKGGAGAPLTLDAAAALARLGRR